MGSFLNFMFSSSYMQRNLLICDKIQNAAIISYKSLPLKKQEKKLIHLVLHAVALILGIIGIYTAFKYHNESGIANLYSLHSWLGIAIIVLYGLQVINHQLSLNSFLCNQEFSTK